MNGSILNGSVAEQERESGRNKYARPEIGLTTDAMDSKVLLLCESGTVAPEWKKTNIVSTFDSADEKRVCIQVFGIGGTVNEAQTDVALEGDGETFVNGLYPIERSNEFRIGISVLGGFVHPNDSQSGDAGDGAIGFGVELIAQRDGDGKAFGGKIHLIEGVEQITPFQSPIIEIVSS